MKNKLKKFDDMFINFFNARIKNRYLDVFMYRITNLGGVIFISIFSIVMLLFGSKDIRLIGVEVLVVLAISQVIVQGLKLLLGRERPYKIIEHLNTFGFEMRDYSFPSGHTTASFSLATTLALHIPRASIIVFLLAMLIGISRIYLGVHYPTDVAAGIILGMMTSFLVNLYLLNYVEKISLLIRLN